jgi:asparagine synthase (glutamine-hydrolysing)
MLDDLNGMYAFAIWDAERRLGFLARDPVGKKPLYYFMDRRGNLYFGSEVKSLLKVPGFSARLNEQAMQYYFSYRHVPCPLSIFEGVNQVPPGHYLLWQPGGCVRVHRYWDVSFQAGEKCPSEPAGLADRLLELLRPAVRRRLVSDVPIGFFLSGGR